MRQEKKTAICIHCQPWFRGNDDLPCGNCQDRSPMRMTGCCWSRVPDWHSALRRIVNVLDLITVYFGCDFHFSQVIIIFTWTIEGKVGSKSGAWYAYFSDVPVLELSHIFLTALFLFLKFFSGFLGKADNCSVWSKQWWNGKVIKRSQGPRGRASVTWAVSGEKSGQSRQGPSRRP